MQLPFYEAAAGAIVRLISFSFLAETHDSQDLLDGWINSNGLGCKSDKKIQPCLLSIHFDRKKVVQIDFHKCTAVDIAGHSLLGISASLAVPIAWREYFDLFGIISCCPI